MKFREKTYVEAAQQGKHQWWRYLLGLLVILVAWAVVGGVATRLVAFSLGGREGLEALSRVDFSAFGPVGGFLVFMTAWPFLLAGIFVAVVWVHGRHPRTLVTAREQVSLRRIGQGFVAWFVPWCLILGLMQYLLYPEAFSFTTDLAAFALLVPLVLVLTAIQTTTEELLYRGYIVQGASVIWSNRVFLALASATIFTLPHLLNPEAQAGGWLTVFFSYFVAGGLLMVIVSLIDGTTELAIGAHFANNIGSALVVGATGSVITSPALFSVDAEYGTFYELSAMVLLPLLFLAIIYLGFKREPSNSEPSSAEIVRSK